MSKFGAMRQQRAERAKVELSAPVPASEGSSPVRSTARQGKKAVSAYFSPEVSRGLNVLAAENGTTLQALMGEAIDLLMRQYGKHPFGER
ncbi:ribbon-helix-helix domain-containing protein [Sphingomonas sp. S-NIH.Pt15_0812]|uniref:ribbon-helix-helix domain-containing protein n=1 Tax=Sphingomonas sp. S-NIH.Pt15_0812 TaxID=1920129 RepID=UPI000F7E099D|nr:ribbon-helix-helix domain-containing protein [Sphingomonas sp. S-NIH.Pt15_0812]RSU45581.1 hypothetical protein BRX43_18405 [Sphingomonas sp. S-NIH.Pt15_0812]